MQADLIVIAVGQTWPDLSIEAGVLAAHGARILDGRTLAHDDPAWSNASGVLLGTAFKMDRSRIRAMPRCRGIVRCGIGYDNVDVAAAEELGIVVAIVRDYCLEEVAEHALAYALTLARALPHWDRNMRSGAWRGGHRPALHRLSALSFGIIGYGLIGRTVAQKASGLFGRILVHDPAVTLTPEDRASGYVFIDALSDLLKDADILSIHLPLSESTRNLIDAAALGCMKPTASVINVSRGGIVDEDALLAAIRAGRISGAALDTFVEEPVPAGHPLLEEPRILLSPHVAWLSEEAEANLRRRAAEELALALEGRSPTSPVTKANTRPTA